MISPMTPPGTKVVCVNDGPSTQFSVRFNRCASTVLRNGKVYTVTGIEFDRDDSLYCCTLAGIQWRGGFALERFRYLDLPKSITDCLTEQPLLIDEMSRALTRGTCFTPGSTSRGLATIQNFTASRCFTRNAGASSEAFPPLTCRRGLRLPPVFRGF
jgi:hypothetical protein